MRMFALLLLFFVLTGCAAPDVDEPAADLDEIHQAAWQGCYHHVAVKMRAGSFNLWNWSTWSVNSYSGQLAPWQSEGAAFNLSAQLLDGRCQFTSSAEAFVYRDVPVSWSCFVTGTSFFCSGGNYQCPSPGMARPYAKWTDPGYSNFANFETEGFNLYPTNEHVHWTVAPARAAISTLAGGAGQRLTCYYAMAGKMIEYDRWQ